MRMVLTSPTPRRFPVSLSSHTGPQRYGRDKSEGQPVSGLRQPITPSMRPDWILVILPTALAVKKLYSGSPSLITTAAFALIIVLPVAVAFSRQSETRFRTEFGPLVLLIASSALVLTRSSGLYNALVFLLITTLVIRLTKTVDARKIIGSLIDGIGLYVLVNVVAYMIGLRSVTESEGLRLSLNSGGVNRIIFPLEHSLNLPPVLAAMYAAAIFFLIREGGWRRRLFRLVCLAAAIVILVGSGTRVPALAAVALPIAAILLPTASRWVAPVAAIFASFSALVLPSIVASVQFILNPLVSLIADRGNSHRPLAALNGRDYVWGNSLAFWREEVIDPVNIFFGYGMQGHYKSGASLTYYNLLDHIFTRDAEKIISMHNSFLYSREYHLVNIQYYQYCQYYY